MPLNVPFDSTKTPKTVIFFYVTSQDISYVKNDLTVRIVENNRLFPLFPTSYLIQYFAISHYNSTVC